MPGADKQQQGEALVDALLEFRPLGPTQHVAATGSWDGWSQPHVMAFDAKSQLWQARVKMPPGAVQFKFLVDGHWVLNDAYHVVDNGMGGHNNHMHVVDVIQDAVAAPEETVVTTATMTKPAQHVEETVANAAEHVVVDRLITNGDATCEDADADTNVADEERLPDDAATDSASPAKHAEDLPAPDAIADSDCAALSEKLKPDDEAGDKPTEQKPAECVIC